MKSWALSFLFLGAISTTALAETIDPVYCPTEIVCTQEGDISSCSYKHNQPNIWEDLAKNINNPPSVSRATYRLEFIIANYHAHYLDGAQCIYKVIADGPYHALTLTSKPEANLEAYYTPDSSWYMLNDYGYCHSDAPNDCPLKAQSALYLRNATESVISADASALGGSPILSLDTDTDSKILYDNLGHCNQDKHCSVDILTKDFRVGRVTLDLEDRLKIISLETHDKSPYAIQQIENFNALEIVGEIAPPRAQITLHNYLNSELTAYVNNQSILDKPIGIPNLDQDYGQGRASFERVQENCKNTQCIIEVKTLQGMKIGSVLVDMDSEMAILSVNSHRPSEILLEQIDERTVGLRYPYIK